MSDSIHNHNVAQRLSVMAAKRPAEIAIAVPQGSHRQGTNRPYHKITFQELDDQSSAIAAGLVQLGLRPGQRIAMLIPFNAEFITVVFALLKAGAAIVLIDPGMGRKHLVRCLEESEPDGFVGTPLVHVIRGVLSKRFPKAKMLITTGRRLGWPRFPTLDELRQSPLDQFQSYVAKLDDLAAIIFTTGSTGPPKGVRYTHRMFNRQIDQIVEHYGIEPGGKDLSGFPLFGLFNAVMGTSTIIPDMNPTRPASVDPRRLIDALDQWEINQSFGSPALWTAVGRYCEQTGRKMPTLKRVLSAGAPVPPRVLAWIRSAMADDGVVFTPYGATEALPVASIESREVLTETAARSREGAGTCVGRPFSGIRWKVIEIDDGPASQLSDIRELPVGQIGELMVTGDVVSQKYETRQDQNAFHKVFDGERYWHRMGDIGYLDAEGRFWFCGRKAHRVQTAQGVLYTIPCEAIFNTHRSVHRTALVGFGEPGKQTAALVVETWARSKQKDLANALPDSQLIAELKELAQRFEHTKNIEHIYIYPEPLPTDIRHNAKIFRERLGPWAAQQLNRK
jgi:olefin beta-lactone synthetase